MIAKRDTAERACEDAWIRYRQSDRAADDAWREHRQEVVDDGAQHRPDGAPELPSWP
jgi:hypothetical protein